MRRQAGGGPGGGTHDPGLRRLVGFGRLLRARGLPGGTGRLLAFCRAVAALDRGDRDSLYWAGRLTMVARKEDFPAYDEAFRAWFPSAQDEVSKAIAEWLPQASLPPQLEVELLEGLAEAGWSPADDADEDDDGEELVGVLASTSEVLRRKSFE